MGGVFVNYRTGDGDWAATLVARELASRFGSDNVFFASKTIRLGEDFAETILKRLVTYDVLLVVIGSRWLSATDRSGNRRIDSPDDWVQKEIGEAFRHGLRVIPVLLDGLRPLREADLPEGIAALARCQYVRLHHRNDDRDIARLLDDLTELVPNLVSSAPPPLPEDAVPECPYRGLQPFREDDAAYFHGRDREVARLARLIDHQPVVVVAGASGSGKSSLVRAGLWPLLRSRNVALVVFRPIAGIAPRTLLASALRPTIGASLAKRLSEEDIALLADPIVEAVGELVLFVDQFEELAAADPAAARELFGSITDLLRAAPAHPGRPPALRAVITVRGADLDEVLTAELTRALEEATVYVRRMGQAELRAAVTEPAAATGLSFETGLVERIVADAADAPAQLPLVEFSLTRLWEAQRGGILTHQAYDEMGGVAGALATYAEELYSERLPAATRELVERLLVQLARPGEEGSFVLSPAPLEQLDPDLRALAIELSTTRLVVIRQDIDQPEMVALAHEALVRSWQRLRDWLVAAQEFRTWQEQLRVTLAQWQRSDRDTATLLRGAPLVTAQTWLTAHPEGLTDQERRYIAASRAHQRRGVRRWRTIAALIVVLALAAAGIGGVAIQQRNTAREQSNVNRSQEIAGLADTVRPTDPALAMQLSLTAYNFAPTARSRASLHAAAVTPFDIKLTGHTGPIRAVAFSPTGRTLATSGEDATVRLWDLTNPHHPTPGATIPTGTPSPTAFSPDGHLVAGTRSRLNLWDITDPHHPTTTAILATQPDMISAVGVGPNIQLLLAIASKSTVDIWDVTDPSHPSKTATLPQPGTVSAVAMSLNGQVLAASVAGRIQLWNIANPRTPVPITTLNVSATSLTFSPGSRYLAAGTFTTKPYVTHKVGTIKWWDVTNPRQPLPARDQTLDLAPTEIQALAFDSLGLRLAAATKVTPEPRIGKVELGAPTGDVSLFGIIADSRGKGDDSASRSGTYSGPDPTTAVAFSPDGKTIASGDAAGAVHLWSTPTPILNYQSVETGPIFSSDSRILAVPDARTGTVGLRDVSDPNHPVDLSTLTGRGDFSMYYADPHTLVTAGLNGITRVWDLKDPWQPVSRATLPRNTRISDGDHVTIGGTEVSPDGRLLTQEDPHDDRTHIWDITDPGHPVEASALPPPIGDSRWNADSHTLVVAAKDGIQLWDITDRDHPSKAAVLPATDTLLLDSARFSGRIAGGRTLITQNGNKFRLWNISDPHHPVMGATLEHARTFTPRAGALSPDNRTFAVADETAQTIVLWDVADVHNPTNLATFLSGNSADTKTSSLKFNPDGHILVAEEHTGDFSTRFHLWDVTDLRNPVDITSIPSTESFAVTTRFSPDGRVAVIPTHQGSYLVDLDTDRLAWYLCGVAGNTITEEQWRQYLPDLPYRQPCP